MEAIHVAEGSPDWKSRDFAVSASHALQKYVVGLRLVLREGNQTYQAVYSGFVLEVDKELFWASAGHCFAHMKSIRSDPAKKVVAADLIDNYPISEATSIPLGTDDFDARYVVAYDGRDVGLFRLRPMHRAFVLSNPNVVPVTPLMWQHTFDALGHYVIGFPEEWVEQNDAPLRRGWRQAGATLGLASFPVDLVPDAGSRNPLEDFWGKPHSIYGRATPYIDDRGASLRTLKGMSGGLLVAIATTDIPGRLKVRLAGIQSSTLGDSTVMRVSTLDELLVLARSTA